MNPDNPDEFFDDLMNTQVTQDDLDDVDSVLDNSDHLDPFEIGNGDIDDLDW